MLRLFVSSTSILMLGLVGQAVAFVVVAHYLVLAQFGQLVTITAITNLAGTWAGLSSGEVLRRRVSRDRSLYAEALGHSLITIFATGVIISILVIGGMMLFMPHVGDRWETFTILLLLVPSNVIIFSYVNQVEFIYLAHNDFTRANIVNGGSGIVRALTAVIACAFFGVVSLRDFAAWWAAAHVVMLLMCVIATRRFGMPRWRVLREELWLGGNLAFSSFLIMLRHSIDILVLNSIATPQFVGVYGAGRRIISAAIFVPGSFDRMIYGRLAVAGKGGPAATLRLAKRYLGYVLVISTATSCSLFLLAPFIPLIFGSNFVETVSVVRILCWILITTAIQFLAFDALNAADQHKVSAVVSGSANVAGAAMVVGFGSLYGTTGIYAALYLSDLIRGGALWLALVLLSQRQARPIGVASASLRD